MTKDDAQGQPYRYQHVHVGLLRVDLIETGSVLYFHTVDLPSSQCKTCSFGQSKKRRKRRRHVVVIHH